VISVDLVSARAFFLLLHARLRVHRASGIPCALYFSKAREIPAKLGRVARREQFWLFENCISTFAVVPASAPGPITTNVFVVRYWSGNPADN